MLKIFWFTLKSNYKIVWMSISIIIVSLALTAILGGAIKAMQESGVYAKETVAIYNDLSSPYKEALDDLLFEEEFEEILIIQKIENLDGADMLLENGDYHTLVIGTTIDGKDTLRIKSSKEESFMFSIGANFTSTINAITLIMDTGVISTKIQQQYSNTVLQTEVLTEGYPIGMDYYGVLTLLQLSAMLAILGVFSMLDDKSKNIFPRISTVPIPRAQIIAGRLLANVVYITSIQIVIAILSSVILGVNWGNNYLVIVAVFALYSVSATVLGMLAAAITKSVMPSIGIVIGIGSILWPKYSGAFSPFASVGKMAVFSPNFHAKNALFSAIYGGSQKIMLEGILWMAVIAVAMLAAYAAIERIKSNDSI